MSGDTFEVHVQMSSAPGSICHRIVMWTPTTITENRGRLLAGDIARRFFQAVLARALSRSMVRSSRRGPV
jgi:hypothetical protein